MQSRWSGADAAECVECYREAGEDLALRVYSSRLIGQEPDLVLHGGGNTSVKSKTRDLFGEEMTVLHVKGSGWNLDTIEPPGLPALRLLELQRLRGLDELDDERMVRELRRSLLDPGAPNPSVETLLHAFLCHKFVDHSHADAILALTNQPDGEKRIHELFGDRVAWAPYVMPGFPLAKQVAEIVEASPAADAIVLEKHGLVTFADEARQSYERHVEIVETAERMIAAEIEGRRLLDARPVVSMREAGEIAPLVRGALAVPTQDPDRPYQRWILEHRDSTEIAHFAAADAAPMLAESPPITPDHVIRTKGPYLYLEEPAYSDLDTLAAQLAVGVEAYRQAYRAYFERNVEARGIERTMLDPTPRVVVLPGLGLFAAGATRKEARIAADIAEHNIKTKLWASMIGQYAGLPESDLFDMEYWSLEQAKLGRRTPDLLEGQVALITGGAGAIGEGIAKAVLAAGGAVMLTDIDPERLSAVADRLSSDRCETFEADVSDARELQAAFRQTALSFGGVDLVVANAGVAVAGRLEELEVEEFQRAVDVNLGGTFLTVGEALRQLRIQGTGGNIIVLSSKNVFAPGESFGAYSASKAGAHQLGRVAALEGAAFGVRVNMINADAVFGFKENPSGLWKEVGAGRAAARGLPEQELEAFYRNRNLLKVRITAEHVGNAVVFFASQATPTTGAALPIDGGLPGAFPR